MEHKEKKLFGKLNIIDAVVIVLIIAVLAFVGYKFLNQSVSGPAERCQITYQVRCEKVPIAAYENAKEHIPCQVMASGVRHTVHITDMEMQPYLFFQEGQWVEDPERVTLIFTLEGTVANNQVLTSDVGGQEVRVGKNDYIVKSEYLEFAMGTVINAQWTRPGE